MTKESNDKMRKNKINRKALTRLFRGVANEKRIRIIQALLAGLDKIGDISDYTGLPYKTVERHLKILVSAGIAKQTRVGKFFDFELNLDEQNYLHLPLNKILETIQKSD